MTSRARGVTLIELLIAIAISAIVLTAIFGVVQGQQTAFYQGNLQRAAQGSARSALAFVEQRLATAGYGMDAPLAFDFMTSSSSTRGTRATGPRTATPPIPSRTPGASPRSSGTPRPSARARATPS